MLLWRLLLRLLEVLSVLGILTTWYELLAKLEAVPVLKTAG